MHKAISIITLILLTVLTVTSASISLELPSSECTVRNIHGYAEFSGSDYACVTGAPKLPASVVRFMVPPDADMSTIRISFSNLREKEIEGIYQVRPVAPAMSTMGTVAKIADRNIVHGKDISIYSSNAFYPANYAKVVSTGKLWNFKILEVIVYPYRYNPVTKKLVKAVNGKLEIDYDRLREKPVFQYPTPRRIRKRAAGLAVNYADVATAYGIAAADNPAIKETYMIVTTQAVKDGLANFDAFVEARGEDYDVQVILEDTWGGGTGDASAENLRAYLKSIYEMMQLSYILLIGDGTPEDGGEPGYDPGDLAMKVTIPWLNTGWHEDKVPTDFYYAELSGDWDPDGDDKFGEAPADGNDQDFTDGGVDSYAELCVGRIPVYENNLEPVDVILKKTVDYIKETDIAWRKNALLIASKLAEPDALSYDVLEALKESGCDPTGVPAFRMYEKDYGCSPEKAGISYSICKNQFASEPYGICNYIGHGNFNKCVDIFQNTDIINFGNDNPSIICAVTCLNNQIEKKFNIGYTFLQHGGIAVLGGTRLTWYCPNSHDYATSVWPTNQVFGYRLAKLLIHDSLTTGESIDETKSHCAWIENPSYVGNLFSYICFGDPALKLWGEKVTAIDQQSYVLGNSAIYPRLYYLNNAIEFRYNHLSNGTITLNIFDLKGKRVYAVEKKVTSSVRSVKWNYNKQVANGLYMARLDYSDGENTTSTFSTKVLLQK